MGLTAGYYSGKDGRLRLSSTGSTALKDIAKVRSWQLSAALSTLETTTLGDYETSYIPGLKSASGNASLLYYDYADKVTNPESNVRSLLNSIISTADLTESNAKVYMELLWNDGLSNQQRDRRGLAFYAYLTSAELGVSTGDLLQVSVSFQMTGDYQTIGL